MRAVTRIYLFNKKHCKTGKTKDIFVAGKDKLLFLFTDRITVHNVLMKEGIPEKGKIQCQLSKFWFKFLEDKKIVKTHFLEQRLLGPKIKAMITWQDEFGSVLQDYSFLDNFPKDEIQERMLIVKRAKKIIPLRFIVRGYLVENQPSVIFPQIKNGGRFPLPLIEILADKDEDEKEKVNYRAAAELLKKWPSLNALSLAPYILLDCLICKSLEIYKVCSEFAKMKNAIIAEAKFEFGFDKEKNLVLVDEILTPDTARFWLKEDWEKGKFKEHYDKKILLDWLGNVGWQKTLPVPKLPKELIEKISQRYREIEKRLAS